MLRYMDAVAAVDADILAPSELEDSDLLKNGGGDDFNFELASRSLMLMSSAAAGLVDRADNGNEFDSLFTSSRASMHSNGSHVNSLASNHASNSNGLRLNGNAKPLTSTAITNTAGTQTKK
jgi:hypothetical protein